MDPKLANTDIKPVVRDSLKEMLSDDEFATRLRDKVDHKLESLKEEAETNTDHIEQLRGRIDNIEQFEKLNDVFIYNLPEENLLEKLPTPGMKLSPPKLSPPKASFDAPSKYSKGVFKFGQNTISSSSSEDSVIIVEEDKDDNSVNMYLGTKDNPNGSVNLNKRSRPNIDNCCQRQPAKRHIVVPNHSILESQTNTARPETPKTSLSEYVLMVKEKLDTDFAPFLRHIQDYRTDGDINRFFQGINPLVPRNVTYILSGLIPYVKAKDRYSYQMLLKNNDIPIPEDL